MSRNISKEKAVTIYLYSGGDWVPEGISKPRWDAIIKHIRRVFQLS